MGTFFGGGDGMNFQNKFSVHFVSTCTYPQVAVTHRFTLDHGNQVLSSGVSIWLG